MRLVRGEWVFKGVCDERVGKNEEPQFVLWWCFLKGGVLTSRPKEQKLVKSEPVQPLFRY